MADEIKKAFDVEIEFLKSSGGRFEITVNEELVYSKANTGRFPEFKKISDAIETRLK
ncbi:MAG TPA: SelT/SelW/SelH family protein [Calditrichaeota bacterium]|nr:SelT/SelW/SelH family protein [Calditrichota bacterium]